jgi:hypothetical protein
MNPNPIRRHRAATIHYDAQKNRSNAFPRIDESVAVRHHAHFPHAPGNGKKVLIATLPVAA